MNKKTMKNILLMTILTTSGICLAETNEIYRYKDKNGNFTYSDKAPTDKKIEVGVLSKKTGVVKNLSELEEARNSQQLTEADKAEIESKKQKESEQLKKDQLLLNSYSSVKDIDNIKKYELEQIDRAIQNDINIIVSQKDRREQIEKLIKENPKSKSEYDKEYLRINQQIDQSNSSLEKNKAMYSEREVKYNNEKERLNAVLKSLNKEDKEDKKN